MAEGEDFHRQPHSARQLNALEKPLRRIEEHILSTIT